MKCFTTSAPFSFESLTVADLKELLRGTSSYFLTGLICMDHSEPATTAQPVPLPLYPLSLYPLPPPPPADYKALAQTVQQMRTTYN